LKRRRRKIDVVTLALWRISAGEINCSCLRSEEAERKR